MPLKFLCQHTRMRVLGLCAFQNYSFQDRNAMLESKFLFSKARPVWNLDLNNAITHSFNVMVEFNFYVETQRFRSPILQNAPSYDPESSKRVTQLDTIQQVMRESQQSIPEIEHVIHGVHAKM